MQVLSPALSGLVVAKPTESPPKTEQPTKFEQTLKTKLEQQNRDKKVEQGNSGVNEKSPKEPDAPPESSNHVAPDVEKPQVPMPDAVPVISLVSVQAMNIAASAVVNIPTPIVMPEVNPAAITVVNSAEKLKTDQIVEPIKLNAAPLVETKQPSDSAPAKTDAVTKVDSTLEHGLTEQLKLSENISKIVPEVVKGATHTLPDKSVPDLSKNETVGKQAAKSILAENPSVVNFSQKQIIPTLVRPVQNENINKVDISNEVPAQQNAAVLSSTGLSDKSQQNGDFTQQKESGGSDKESELSSNQLSGVNSSPAVKIEVNSAAPVAEVANFDTSTRLQIVQQVSRHIAQAHLAGQEKSITIRLDPPHLGSIELTVKSKGDSIQASITAQHDWVRHAAAESVDKLRETLAQRGLSLGDLDVSSQNSDANNQPLRTSQSLNKNGNKVSTEQGSNTTHYSQPLHNGIWDIRA